MKPASSAPKEEVLLRLFDALGGGPQLSVPGRLPCPGGIRSDEEQALLEDTAG